MHLFSGQVKQLYGLSANDIKNLLIEGLTFNTLAEVEFNKQEVDTWGISVQKLVNQLYRSNLGEIEIVLEYFIPGNLLRIDVVLIGYNQNLQQNVMVVELKEWGKVISSPDPHHVDIGVRQQPIRQHPAAQLNHYVTSLKCYHSEIQKNASNIVVSSMSYLPNFSGREELFGTPHDIYIKYKETCFTKENEDSLPQFLRRSFKNIQIKQQELKLILHGIYSMSEASLAGISKAMRGERFVSLLEEQRDVKIKIMKMIDNAFSNNQQIVIVIQGDAGTGKTILGLDIIRQYIKKYPNSSFGTIPQTLRTVIDGLNKEYAFENDLDEPAKLPTVNALLRLKTKGQIVVIDEAHRLTDVDYAIKNLYSRVQVIVLLQDDKQRIKITEQGTLKNIERALGWKPEVLKLQSQQRAKNSGTFMSNLEDFLTNTRPSSVALGQYDLKVDSLDKIDSLLKEKMSEGNTVKWLAPFCWKWNGKPDDIIINDNGHIFKKSWNPTVTSQYEWFRQKSDNHIDQVGCIYTAQGLEFDYIGFIFWDDLYFDSENGKWRVTLRDNQDNSFIDEIIKTFEGTFNKKNRKVLYNGRNYEIDEFLNQINANEIVLDLITNIYRVLLSRGKKGLYIWFRDHDTKEYFKKHFVSNISEN